MKRIFYRQSAALNHSAGIALITVLLLLLVLSAVAVGLMYTVNTEQHLQSTDSANSLAYYSAEAGMEKMMSDLADLYNVQTAPTANQIAAVACPAGGACANSPDPATLNATTFSEYQIAVPLAADGINPAIQQRTISSGPNEGLQAEIIPLTLQVTADRPGGEEVRLLRDVEVALIPVFQFGVFSDSDLSYFAGPTFTFGGRVHTNTNLFLAEGAGNNLVFTDKVHAVFDIVRDTMANGNTVQSGNHTGGVYLPAALGGCNAGPGASCVALTYTAPDQGSSIGGSLQPPTEPSAGGVANPQWGAISNTIYNGFVKNAVKPLKLPFVKGTTQPIELIRRAITGEPLLTSSSRLYNKAQVRVLLSNDPAELPGGAGDPQNIRLSNVAPYAAGITVTGGAVNPTYFAEEKTAVDADWTGAGYRYPPLVANSSNLVDGWLRVEVRDAAGNYTGVTDKWLALGIARQQQISDSEHGVANTVNPNAILLFQQLRDGLGAPTNPSSKNDWYPINMYDVHEGEVRDVNSGNCNIQGVLNLVDIDVRNLQTWLAANPAVENVSQNGYVLYFSDRRGMITDPLLGIKTGAYGFDDVVNGPVPGGVPNGILDQGEAPNTANPPKVNIYGQNNLGEGFNAAGAPILPPTVPVPLGCNVARKNWVSGARHGVRLINGSQGNLPKRPNADVNNNGGFTLASENPAYVLGNYNSNDAGLGNPHASAAVIADTVTLLSTQWTDLNSFNNSTNLGGRNAVSSTYRLAIAAGKNRNFKWSNVVDPVPNDFGTDGGVHNFLRYLENWGGQTSTYTGSIVSLYYSAYATGIFKCCTIVYSPPNRNYNFDNDFLNLSEIPPGTPRLEDVVNVGFRQDFTNR